MSATPNPAPNLTANPNPARTAPASAAQRSGAVLDTTGLTAFYGDFQA